MDFRANTLITTDFVVGYQRARTRPSRVQTLALVPELCNIGCAGACNLSPGMDTMGALGIVFSRQQFLFSRLSLKTGPAVIVLASTEFGPWSVLIGIENGR